MFKALDRCFPQAAKVKCMLMCKFPLDALLSTKVGNRGFHFQSDMKLMDIDISRGAPTKLAPWSLQITEGLPQQAINLCRVAKKAFVVKSDTGLR